MAKYKVKHIGWFFKFIWNCITDLVEEPIGFFKYKIGKENWTDFKHRMSFDTDPEMIELVKNLRERLEKINNEKNKISNI